MEVMCVVTKGKVIELRRNRKPSKRCECEDKRFIIDVGTRTVRCRHCGAEVDPIDVLVYLNEHYKI